jgi:hypothetical protein
MTKQITIEVRSIYGQSKAYPVCADSQLFAQMLRTKTLTREALKDILALGYEIEARAACPGITFAVRVTKASDIPAVA